MAQDSNVPTSIPDRFASLHERVTEAMETYGVPGVAVGIIVAGEEHVAAFGVTNIDYPTAVLPDTLFQIGSTTKTVTATAVMRLVEAGSIDLDVPVRTYLPELRLRGEGVAERVTMRQLLTHTAGWTGDYFADFGRGENALTLMVESMVDLEQVTPLGEIWSYNNAGFYLAGRVIEAVTGKPYEVAIRELVLDPLGMTSSFFFPEDVMLRSFAVGHNPGEDGPTVARPWPIPRACNPAGGLASTPGDQLRYARFHMGDGTTADGERLLSPDSMHLMQTPMVEAGEGMRMGLSWFLRDVGGVRLVQHGGSTNGQQSSFAFAPDRDFALTILTNSDLGTALNTDIERWALHEYLGVEEPTPVHESRTPAELAEYLGVYVTALTEITVSAQDSALVLTYAITGDFPSDTPPPVPPPTTVAFYGPDVVIALEGPLENVRGEFLRGDDGTPRWLRFGGRLHTRRDQ